MWAIVQYVRCARVERALEYLTVIYADVILQEAKNLDAKGEATAADALVEVVVTGSVALY